MKCNWEDLKTTFNDPKVCLFDTIQMHFASSLALYKNRTVGNYVKKWCTEIFKNVQNSIIFHCELQSWFCIHPHYWSIYSNKATNKTTGDSQWKDWSQGHVFSDVGISPPTYSSLFSLWWCLHVRYAILQIFTAARVRLSHFEILMILNKLLLELFELSNIVCFLNHMSLREWKKLPQANLRRIIWLETQKHNFSPAG